MGNDGGSIPRRDELCKLKKGKAKADRDDLKRANWTICKVSQEPLRPPIVTCRLGFLYNKEAIIQNLLRKSLPSELGHITKLKDVVEIHLHSADGKGGEWTCPITQRELTGQHRVVCLKPCGHVILDQALRHVPTQTCLVCSAPFTPQDVWTINGPEEEVKKLKEQIEAEKAAEKKGKKEKSKEKEKEKEKRESGTSDGAEASDGPKRPRTVEPHAIAGLSVPANADPQVYRSLFLPKENPNPSV